MILRFEALSFQQRAQRPGTVGFMAGGIARVEADQRAGEFDDVHSGVHQWASGVMGLQYHAYAGPASRTLSPNPSPMKGEGLDFGRASLEGPLSP